MSLYGPTSKKALVYNTYSWTPQDHVNYTAAFEKAPEYIEFNFDYDYPDSVIYMTEDG